jgi:hypothetical protein
METRYQRNHFEYTCSAQQERSASQRFGRAGGDCARILVCARTRNSVRGAAQFPDTQVSLQIGRHDRGGQHHAGRASSQPFLGTELGALSSQPMRK